MAPDYPAEVADKRAESRRKMQGGPPNQRSWFLPVVAVVIALGVVAVGALALTRDPGEEATGLQIGDHWHMAYGVYDCDTYLPPSQDGNDPLGIHTHGDGLIHAHPGRVAATGDRARLGLFIDAIGAELSDDQYLPGAGEPGAPELRASDGCDGEPAELVLAYWPDATQDTAPELIRSGLADVRLTTDGAAFAIALVPEGTTDIPKPPFLDQLQNPSDT